MSTDPTTEPSREAYVVTTISGRSREIPANLVDDVIGLDGEGRIVVDHFGALDSPTDGAFVFGLTLCCNASDKGVEDGIVCRGCYSEDETGSYLFAVLSGAGDWSFPGFDPVSDLPHPVRFTVRKDDAQPYYGIWANDEQTWVTDLMVDDALWVSGADMWSSEARAQEIADELNADVADGLGEEVWTMSDPTDTTTPATSPRFEARAYGDPTHYGIWDNETDTWNEGVHGDAEYADGIPFWASVACAREVAAEMNAADESLKG